jgi:RND family efflux transporter MFP subunit
MNEVIAMEQGRRITITAVALLSATVCAAQEQTFDCVMEPRATLELGSADEGVLQDLFVDRGDVIRQGQRLATLNDTEQRLQVERARIRAEADVEVRSKRAEAEYRRIEEQRIADLYKDKLVSDREFEEARIETRLAELALQAAETEFEVAKVEYRQAEEKLARRSITSPVNGVVVNVTMGLGEYVHKQATVMTIAEIDPLNVEVFVTVDSYGTITVGTEADVMPEEPVGGTYRATVAVADRVFDAASRTFGVRMILPNPDFRLPAGTRCEVRFARGGESIDP